MLAVDALLAVLNTMGVRYVVVGSVAVQVHGVGATPRDLDVVPALEADNLARLSLALDDLQAHPIAESGRWQIGDDGEARWAEGPAIALATESSRDPQRPATFDHRFATPHGVLDVVPEVAGAFEQLISRAARIAVAGVDAHVAHVDDLLAVLTVARRARDAGLVRELRREQRRRAAGG